MSDSWSCRHFSMSNAADDRPHDLAHLLRRVATEIDSRHIAPMHILDLSVSQQITETGPVWSASLYWSSDDIPSPPRPRGPG